MNVKIVLALAIGALMCGCATTPQKMAVRGENGKNIPLEVYKHDLTTAAMAGYQEGVKQGAEAARRMYGPYVWRPYKTQVVQVPAEVVNGIFYPGHQEEVIVRPTELDRVYGQAAGSDGQ